MTDNTRKKIERYGLFFGSAAYSFVNAPIIMVREIKHERKRKKMEKGLEEWNKIIKEMKNSGEYTEELLNNVVLWFAEAERQYYEMS